MAGKNDFQVDGEQIIYDLERAQEFLEEAGVEMPYPITMVYHEVDPLQSRGRCSAAARRPTR